MLIKNSERKEQVQLFLFMKHKDGQIHWVNPLIDEGAETSLIFYKATKKSKMVFRDVETIINMNSLHKTSKHKKHKKNWFITSHSLLVIGYTI